MEPRFSDDDEVETVKRWWREYGRSIVVGVTLGLLAMAGFRAWLGYQEERSQSASLAYTRVLEALNADDRAQVLEHGRVVVDEYSGTPYADLARFAMARVRVEEGGAAEAAELLRSVVANGATEALRQLARLRLAQALLAAGQAEQALSVLAEGEPGSFAARYAAVRGDIHAAQGRTAEAHEEYGQAIAQLPADEPLRMLLELKRNDLALGSDAAGQESAGAGA